ncbi:MAG: hypothetical protein QNJ33_08570 [Crocosphaera sp.]|nr:hypothetical protein [Crocosphaera sp.]
MSKTKNNQPPEQSNQQPTAKLKTNDTAKDNNSNSISFDIKQVVYVQDSVDNISEIIYQKQQE